MIAKPSISDKAAYYALLFVEKPFGLIPTSWMWRIGAGLGKLAYRFAKKRKAIVLANLKIVHPEQANEEIITLAKEVFRNSFANLTSSINTGFVSSKKIPKIVSLEGQQNIRNLEPNKGCIMLLFHMGNWELLSRITPMLETKKPSAAMFRPLNNSLINKHITQSRERDGTQLFGRKKGLIQASKFLRDGGILGILGDQHAGNPGIQLPLFGKETSITPLPSMLAQKYGCPVIPVTLSTIAPGKWIVTLKPPITIPKELNKTDATKQLIPTIEAVMKEHSSDIFWLHDRWKIKHTLKS